jgi:leucyl aminopeptidase (aminopeptidase T)
MDGMDSVYSDTVLSERVYGGITALFDQYANLSHLDHVVIAYTPDVRTAAATLAAALPEWTTAVELVPMQPLNDSGFESRLARAVKKRKSDAARVVVFLLEWDTMSHNTAVRSVLREIPPESRLVLRCINVNTNFFDIGLSVSPKHLSHRNSSLLSRFQKAEALHYSNANGSDVQITLDNKRYRWISNRGVSEGGKFIVLPAGEIASFPAAIEGHFVADFAINVNFAYDGDARLGTWPVRIDISNGQLNSLSCGDPAIERYLRNCFSRPNAKLVGEIGFGTHTAVTDAVPENSHLNERCPGFHIGFGQHNQTDKVAGYSCDIHIDLIAQGGRVRVTPSSEVISLTDSPERAPEHPALIESNDLFSPDDVDDDCCGISNV